MRYVETNKPIKTVRTIKTKVADPAAEGGFREVETTRDILAKVEFGQFDSLDEAIQEAGGEAKFLEWVNSKKEADAKVGPRNYGRVAPAEQTDEQIIEKMRDLARTHSLASARTGIGAKKKAEAFDELANVIRSNEAVSREDLLAMLERLR